MGRGPSSASQTAWGVMGLLAYRPAEDAAVRRGIAWLVERQLGAGRRGRLVGGGGVHRDRLPAPLLPPLPSLPALLPAHGARAVLRELLRQAAWRSRRRRRCSGARSSTGRTCTRSSRASSSSPGTSSAGAGRSPSRSRPGCLAFGAEFSSTRNGFPFGPYRYFDETRTRELWISNVPFWDSLSFVFLSYFSLALAAALLSPAAERARGSSSGAPAPRGAARWAARS